MNLKHFDKIVPDAYHGTRSDYAQNVIQNKKFHISTGKEQYLGDGVYFFEGSKWNAKDWARRKFKGEQIGIIKATINLWKCLDLNNKEHLMICVKTQDSIKDCSLVYQGR